MKTVISARDIEDLLRSGGSVASLPGEAIYTPSARDLLRDLEAKGARTIAIEASPAANSGDGAHKVTSKSSKAELEAFFRSPAIHVLKEQICEIGRRLWQREYVDG